MLPQAHQAVSDTPVWQGDLDPITGIYIRDPNRVYTAKEEAEIAQHNDITTRCRQRKEAQAKEAKERVEERERAERERGEQANNRSAFIFDDIHDDDPTPNGHAPNARERLAASQAEQAEIEEEHEARRQRKRRLSGEPEEPKRTDAEWTAYHTQRTRHAQTKPAEKKPSEKRRLRDSLNNHLCGKLADCDTSAGSTRRGHGTARCPSRCPAPQWRSARGRYGGTLKRATSSPGAVKPRRPLKTKPPLSLYARSTPSTAVMRGCCSRYYGTTTLPAARAARRLTSAQMTWWRLKSSPAGVAIATSAPATCCSGPG